jgi:hypothetical protein
MPAWKDDRQGRARNRPESESFCLGILEGLLRSVPLMERRDAQNQEDCDFS